MRLKVSKKIHWYFYFAIVLLGVGIGVFGLSLQSLAAPASPKGGQGSIVFTAILDKSEYVSDEPVDIIFILRNQGKNPVYVNKRFFLSSEAALKNQKEVYATITSPSGKNLSFKSPYETGYPKIDYFVLLEPGQEVQSEYPRNLRGNFEFTEPGTYTVTAVYQNTFGRELGLDVFGGKLTAEPVKFVIKNGGGK
jgi:hypothetical protein